MKQHFSVEMMTPEQYESIGVDIEDAKSDVQLALMIFAHKLDIELLNAFYHTNPGQYQMSRPEKLANALRSKGIGPNSPYPPGLITALEHVDAAMKAAWEEMCKFAKATRREKNATIKMLRESETNTST